MSRGYMVASCSCAGEVWVAPPTNGLGFCTIQTHQENGKKERTGKYYSSKVGCSWKRVFMDNTVYTYVRSKRVMAIKLLQIYRASVAQTQSEERR